MKIEDYKKTIIEAIDVFTETIDIQRMSLERKNSLIDDLRNEVAEKPNYNIPNILEL